MIINIIQESFSHTFLPIKMFGQLLHVSPLDILPFILLKTFNSKFPYTEVCFTDEIIDC